MLILHYGSITHAHTIHPRFDRVVPCMQRRVIGACLDVRRYRKGMPLGYRFMIAVNASLGTSTVPSIRIFFLPCFCCCRSFFLRLISPP